jgi:hypothetical protein
MSNNGTTKLELMETVYRPGMSAPQLAEAVADHHGVSVSDRYARDFISRHDAEMDTRETAAMGAELELLRESLQRLEQALYAPGWRQLTTQANQEFSREGIRQIAELARIMRIKNPIIKRGVNIQKLYVWAQGFSVRAADEEINAVVQEFMDDEKNRAALTTHQARGEREVDLQTEGNLFIRFFVDQRTGRTRLRFIPADEVLEIICNPEDRDEPWFYKRTYSVMHNNHPGPRTAYYPDWRFTPTNTTVTAGGQVDPAKVDWSTPVYHIATNRIGKFGVCEFYDALDWALAFKSFLEQLASVWQALARWAHKLTIKGGARERAAAKSKLGTTLSSALSAGETNPPPLTGSTFIQSDGAADLQPFRTAGATMSAEDGRRLMLMGIMAFGFPETFFGDVSVGTLATAKSLDRPTELKIRDRQELWSDIFQNIIGYAIKNAVTAPQGPLRGMAEVKKIADGDEMDYRLQWQDDIDPTVEVTFPPIIEQDTAPMISSVIDAATMKGGGGIPAETAVAQLLRLLNVPDADAVMEIWREEQEERAARAEEMAARMGGSGSDDSGEDEAEEDDTDEALRQAIDAVNGAIADLRETNA